MSDRARVLAAARDNAEWCDAYCASHGVHGAIGRDAWTSPRRTPEGYPDAVTLRPGVDAVSLLAQLDAGPGCSVKDSFDDLDLLAAGFEELVRATWTWRPPPAPVPDAPVWQEVTDEARLVAWEAAWGGGPPGGRFRPDLLGHPRVRLLADARDGVVRAGCVVTRGSAGVVGVSNVFDLDGADPWRGILAWVAARAPDRAVVGYESGPALDAALAAGFEAAGRLRIWHRARLGQVAVPG